VGGKMTPQSAAEIYPPGEFLREELEARNWTQGDLAEILGRPLARINEIICGKRAITPETAKGLSEALGTSADLWLNLENAYQLSKVKKTDNAVERRSKLYAMAPVREMVKRNWIEHSDNIEVLEARICEFFKIKSVTEEPSFWNFAARTSLVGPKPTPAQMAWLFRAKQLARSAPVRNKFSEQRLEESLISLRSILHSPEEVRKVPVILSDAGIRLIILEPLPNTRIDGATFWINNVSPVIALSVRFDRIDWFWHTLIHEIFHVKEKHGLNDVEPLDIDLVGDKIPLLSSKSEIEKLVDKNTTEYLIPVSQINDFIVRVRPLYSTNRIIGFAGIRGIHPGIVVGQLQYRGEIPYKHSRKLLVKIRNIITESTLTDGWGHLSVGT
jgi:HTH-type transcriptional regulator / antitoxin HigA